MKRLNYLHITKPETSYHIFMYDQTDKDNVNKELYKRDLIVNQ